MDILKRIRTDPAIIAYGLYLYFNSRSYRLASKSLDFLIYCVLPTNQKHGFGSMGVCFNNADYYSNNSSKLAFSPEKIGVAAKCAGMDLKIVLRTSTYIRHRQIIKSYMLSNNTLQ
ncbi:MAG: hypothetical protein DLM72_07255 [Candidatus Nitrosopolaris wilkensis]|nr:MAG: hypothetical protein DLM72_07255 [Candidatus Nitrosopolaris wilkensis]